MNCKITSNYFAEKARMTKTNDKGSCTIICTECPLSMSNNRKNVPCITFEKLYTEKALEIVQKWSDEHKEKTILDDFLEKYPNALLSKDGKRPLPIICANKLGYKVTCDYVNHDDCTKCWQTPLDEVIKK